MGPTILFTHLKIIFLQCFQFSVFSNNKFNPNTPIRKAFGLGHLSRFLIGMQIAQGNLDPHKTPLL